MKKTLIVLKFCLLLLTLFVSVSLNTVHVRAENEHVLPTDNELELADNAYYLKKGNFNPNEKVVNVSNWTEFVRAYKDNTVTKIKLTTDITSQDISVDGVSTTIFGDNADEYRKSSLVIDGGYTDSITGETKQYGLTLIGSKMLRTSNAPTGFTETAADGSTQNRSMFHLKNLSIAQPGTENAYSYGFIGAPGVDTTVAGENVNAPYSKNWYFRFTNVNTDIDDNTTAYRGVARAIVGYQSEVTLAGRVELSVTGETFYLGSLIVEPKASFKGITEYSNYSVVWFVDRIDPKTTAANGQLTIGKDSFVYLKNITGGTSYPGFYGDYGDGIIDEGATLNIDMQGNAWRFDTYNSTIRVKKDATVNLISRGTGSVLTFGGGPGPFADGYGAQVKDNSFIVEPGANFFAYGETAINRGTIETQGTSTNNSFVLDSPKSFDIRNSTNNTASNTGSYRAVNMYNSATVANGRNSNTFEIMNSDVSLWKNGAAGGSSNGDIDGLAQESYVKVAGFKMNSQNSNTYASSLSTPYPVATDANFTDTLGKFNPIVTKRITGINTAPEVIWSPVTDADKSLKVRVYLGDRPTGYDENGNTILVPIYATTGEASVYFTDTFGNKYGPILTDSNGYAKVPAEFQNAGEQVTAHAERGPAEPNKWVGDEESVTVIDVTPPNPAEIEEGTITNSTKQLKGKNAEPNSKFYISINGVRQNFVGNVNEKGSWEYNLPYYLEKGDIVQIFLEDNASKITADIEKPATNSESGNINPENDLSYRDAVFKAATKYIVEDILPDKPQLVKTFESDSSEGIQVGDTLTYKINVKNNKESSFNTIWKQVVVTDVLPEGLLFDKATANMKINNLAIPETDYSFDESTRTLTIPVGNLNSQESSVISFNTKLGSSSVGKVITNKAKATGNSPREKDFVVGPEDDKNERATYSAEGEVSTTEVYGVIELVSAPKTINFGTVSYDATVKRVDNGIYDQDLIVNDTRARKSKWTLGAKLISQMTNTDDESIKLVDSLQYVNGDKTVILSEDLQGIYQSADKPAEDETVINISDTWGSTKDSNGIKLVIDPTKSKITNGQYTGEIEWQLMEATP